jgi:hypothetical protein
MLPENPSTEKYIKEKECTTCNLYTSTYAVMYTMYTRYTTFRFSLSKIHNSIKQLSKKAITHYVVDSIYRYSLSRKVYIQSLTFWKNLNLKTSTYLTRCIHSISLNFSEWAKGSPKRFDYQDFGSVQCIHVTHRLMVDGLDIYIIWQFTLSFYNGKIRRFQDMFSYGDDYE